ncbi:hypothetical protein HOY80DRAFT_1024259 [Tuber brumale]|nr:hypothetical protein HOY80DRAFT_1024259 [Tuber brumale]
MPLNDLPHPPDEGSSQGTRKKSQEDDTMSFQEKFYWQEANSAAQRPKHSQSKSPEAVDTAAGTLGNREAFEEYLDFVRTTEKLHRSITPLPIESNTGLDPPIETSGGEPVANEQTPHHNKSVLSPDEHEPDSEETARAGASVSVITPATTTGHENSDSLQAKNTQMENKIEHGEPESTSPATSIMTVISPEVPNESSVPKTLSGPLTPLSANEVNPETPPTPSSLDIDIANQPPSPPPNESPGALRLESFSPIMNTIKENNLVEDRWRDSQVYGGALEEYLAPLARHSLINAVGSVEGGVAAPLSAPGWIPEVTLSSPPGQTIVFSSPSSICTTSTRSGIPRSTATFGKDKELPLTPPVPITAKKLISKTLKGKETGPRAKGAKAEPTQLKPCLTKTLRTASGGDGNTSNITKLLAKKTYPPPKNEAPPKEKTVDLGRFTSLRDTSVIPKPGVIDRSLLARDGNNRKLPVAKMIENAKPEIGTKPKAVAPLVPTNPRSQNIAPTTKLLSNKPLTSPSVHRGKHAPGYIMDKRGARTSISSSLLSSPKGRFNSAISIYEDTPLLREDSSSTLLSAASNSSESIATMAQAEPVVLTRTGLSKGSPKLVEVSKNAMEFGISLGPDNSQCMVRSPSRAFSRNSISTVLECEEEDAPPPPPPKAVSGTADPAGVPNPLSSAGEHLDENHDKSCEAENIKNLTPPLGLIVQPDTSQPLVPSLGVTSSNERTNIAAASIGYPSPGHGKVLSETHQRTTSTGSNKTTKSMSTTTSTSTSRSSGTVKATMPRYNRNDTIIPKKTIPTKPPENSKATAKNVNPPATKNFLRRGSGTRMKSSFTFQAPNLSTAPAESIDPNLSSLDANSAASSHDIIQNSEAKNKLKPTNEYAHNRNNPPSGEWLRSSDHNKRNMVKNMGDSGAIIGQETLVFTNPKPGDTTPTKYPETLMPRRVSPNHPAGGPLRRNDGNQTLPRGPPTEKFPERLTPTKIRALADLSAIGSNRNPRTLPSPGRSWFGRRSLVSAPTSAISGKENYDPSNAQEGTTPINKEKAKSRSLGNLTGWLHRSPKISPDGLFSRGAKKDKNKLAKVTSSLTVHSAPATLTPQPLGRREQKAEFSHSDVENLIKRLSTQLPSTPDGSREFNALGGKYYTSGYIPNLDESPSKESNPIAVCMDLINSASEEGQSPRRERLLQMSSIMVDAVSKSRDAECAAEEAKIAAAKAECAFLETRKCLQAMTELLKKRGKDALCEILF